jgi:hypothetical protein
MGILSAMRNPLYVQSLTEDEQQTLQEGLRSSEAFILRRCQILLASARGQTARVSAETLGCDDQTVRNAIHAFTTRGQTALTRRAAAPQRTPQAAFTPLPREQLRAWLHQSPRTFGHPTSRWTLPLAAEVAYAEGLTARQWRSHPASTGSPWCTLAARQTLDHQSRSGVHPQQKRRDRLMALAATHPTWALGWGDEVWWSRVAHPALHTWPPNAKPIRLQELTPPRHERAPKAWACYGLLVRHVPHQPEQMLLQFVEHRPGSAKTTALLAWGSARLAAQGLPAVLLIWAHASWHISHEGRTGRRQHNHQGKQPGQGVRILACRLPSKSPWLNPIEPKWVHGKRAMGAPDRLLRAQEIMDRVYAYDECADAVHLDISKTVA